LAARRSSVIELELEKEHNEKIMKRIDSSPKMNAANFVQFESPVKSNRAIQPLMLTSPSKPQRALIRNQTSTNLVVSSQNKVMPSPKQGAREGSGPITHGNAEKTANVIAGDQKVTGSSRRALKEVSDEHFASIPVINPNSTIYWSWNALILVLVLFR
jgi:hypothetical protein